MIFFPDLSIGFLNAWIFTSIFILQMMAIMLLAKPALQRSHVPAEIRKKRGDKSVGMTGNLIWFLSLFYSVFLPLQFGSIWFYPGLFCFLIGSFILILATISFISAPEDQPITGGIYQFSRHPMYLATFLICLGSGLATESGLFTFLSILLAFCLYKEALIEERYCLEKYSHEYQKYIKRTPRWIGLGK